MDFIHGRKLFNVLVNAKVCQPAGKNLLPYVKENYHFEEMARSDITIIMSKWQLQSSSTAIST